jgi:kinetochore protein Spc7/SPC105
MTYKQEVELVYDMAAFRPNQQNQSIDLWYIADNREIKPKPKTAVHDFFLESIRDQIRALPQSQTPVAKLLSVVQAGWDKAIAVSSQLSDLNVTFPTTISRTSDSVMSITSSLLLVPLETRVEAVLHLHSRSGGEGLEIGIKAEARVIYGEHFNVGKIGEFLVTRIGNTLGAEMEEWSAVMVELHQRLIARGRKQ